MDQHVSVKLHLIFPMVLQRMKNQLYFLLIVSIIRKLECLRHTKIFDHLKVLQEISHSHFNLRIKISNIRSC